MLSKRHKLNSQEFKTVFDNGKTVHSDYFTVKYLSHQDVFKAAVAVSKKHTKTAVRRNYKRRVIYNAIVQLYKEEPTRDHIYAIFILKKNALETKPIEIKQDIGILLEKIQSRI